MARPGGIAGAAFLAALLLLAFASRDRVAAVELLENGGFEAWASGEPAGWGAQGTVTQVSSPAVSGSAAQLEGAASLTQFQPAIPGRQYAASVQTALSGGSAVAVLRLWFVDSALQTVGTPTETSAVAGSSFQALSVLAAAPAGAAHVGFRVSIEPLAPPASVVFDSATLDEEDAPEPTATPTNTPTPTATPTDDPPGPPNATATIPSPGGGSRPRVPPGVGPGALEPPPGELLRNGAFEFASEGVPLYWDNFGGELRWADTGGSAGSAAASLISTTASTKWIFQVVEVRGGAWYAASARGAVTAGEAEVAIGLLWYPTFDASQENIGSDESEGSTSPSWSQLATGPVQAPPGARTVRFRLMLRADFASSVAFDDASLVEVPAPAGTPPPGSPSPAQSPPPEASPSVSPPPSGPTRVPTPAPPRTGLGGRLQSADDILITEIVANPIEEGRDAPFEWVELQNVSDQPIDIAGWSIGDSVSLDVLQGPAVVPPGGLAVVAGASATFGPDVAVIHPADGEIGSGLNNDEDTVRLLRPDGSSADAVVYGRDIIPAAPAGTSLSLDVSGPGWLSGAPATPGQSFERPSIPAAPLAQLPIAEDGNDPSRIPWIVLGVCVAIGVFSAPFAVARVREEWRSMESRRAR
jgi:hypothetical protein